MSNFRLNVAARLALIVVCIFMSLWGWVVAHWLVTPLVAGSLAVLVTVEMLWYIERTQRELASFLTSIAHHDYSVPIPLQNKGKIFDVLEQAYRTLSAEFKHLNQQKAANHQYLEAIIQHVGVALISFDDTGEVTLLNEPARHLFDLPHVPNVTALARFETSLPSLLQSLGDGDRRLLRVQRGDDTLQLVVYVTEFALLERRYKLVSFQNIRDELEKREIESWQKLIRVLTHEIMNSVTPITSLSKWIQDTLTSKSPAQTESLHLTAEEHNDLLRSVNAVHSRSTGLLEFVKAYRSFATVPVPSFTLIEVRPLLERVRVLMSESLETHHIALEINCSNQLSLDADAGQIEQVLINLVRNAIEALGAAHQPKIILQSLHDNQDRLVIEVIDNGPGIEAEHLENIFVPFFTTKRGGSGVGLSISRQLVQANHGTLSVKPNHPHGSVFAIRFPG